MTQSEKLEALVRYALEHRWYDPFGIIQFGLKPGLGDNEWHTAHDALCVRLYGTQQKFEDQYYRYPLFLFDHAFAKALFGEEPHGFDPNLIIMETPPIEWMYHLQRAVVSDDPIDYMYGAVFPEAKSNGRLGSKVTFEDREEDEK